MLGRTISAVTEALPVVVTGRASTAGGRA